MIQPLLRRLLCGEFQTQLSGILPCPVDVLLYTCVSLRPWAPTTSPSLTPVEGTRERPWSNSAEAMGGPCAPCLPHWETGIPGDLQAGTARCAYSGAFRGGIEWWGNREKDNGGDDGTRTRNTSRALKNAIMAGNTMIKNAVDEGER